MAPTVLGLGIPANSPMTPPDRREALIAALAHMETDMNASAYDWEMLYFTPDMDVAVLVAKLHEKKWDVVMVGSKCLLIVNPLIAIHFVDIRISTLYSTLSSTLSGQYANKRSFAKWDSASYPP